MKKLFRSAFRNRGLTIINIVGLTLAITVALFLTSYLKYEFSFDKDFKDADRIYRPVSIWGDLEDDNLTIRRAANLGTLAPALMDEVPEIQYVSRVFTDALNITLENKEKFSLRVFIVDPSFIDIFSFTPIYGSLDHSLKNMGTCIITQSSATRLFGENVNPIGQKLTISESEATIEAVIKDLPDNTHLNFNLLAVVPNIYGYNSLDYYTYYKLHDNADAKQAVSKCIEVNNRLLNERFKEHQNKSYFDTVVEPLTSIHTSTISDWDLSPKADRVKLILILLITLLLLTIAIINFVSLFTLQGEKRSKEIGVMKINGATRANIVNYIFKEVFLIVSISFLSGVALYVNFSNSLQVWTDLSIPPFSGFDIKLWIYFITIFLIIILLSAAYPVYILSRLSPSHLIRNSRKREYKMTAWSVIVQFSIVIFALSCLLVVGRQIRFMQNMPLGFNADNIFEIYLYHNLESHKTIKSKLLQYPHILNVASSGGTPLSGNSGQGISNYGSTDLNINIEERRTGPGYLDIYEIPIILGDDFTHDPGYDNRDLILSQSLVNALKLDDPIGKKVSFSVFKEPCTIIGVTQDFHYKSAHQKIGYLLHSAYRDDFYTLSVKFEDGYSSEAMSIIRSVLKELYDDPTIPISLVSDRINNLYNKEKVTYRILISGTVIAIVISLLGLLALSGFVARQKQKEVSVRRVYGAQIDEAIMSLNYFILLRILPAIPIGVAASWFLMKKWLANFAYSIHLSWTIFLIAVIITLLLALITTLFHSIKAATSNPARVLKSNE